VIKAINFTKQNPGQLVQWYKHKGVLWCWYHGPLVLMLIKMCWY